MVPHPHLGFTKRITYLAFQKLLLHHDMTIDQGNEIILGVAVIITMMDNIAAAE